MHTVVHTRARARRSANGWPLGKSLAGFIPSSMYSSNLCHAWVICEGKQHLHAKNKCLLLVVQQSWMRAHASVAVLLYSLFSVQHLHVSIYTRSLTNNNITTLLCKFSVFLFTCFFVFTTSSLPETGWEATSDWLTTHWLPLCCHLLHFSTTCLLYTSTTELDARARLGCGIVVFFI